MSVINTNITSMIGQSNLSKSQNALQTSMERLSSGLRINSAKDDAAGQAIANRMTAQITGLAQAQRNANDGISVAQTAEGALNQVNDNLQRIRELAVQAANGTNSSNDLQSIQDEIGQRLEEIDRISRETNFNGTDVLALDRDLTIQVGANDGQTIEVKLQEINATTLNLADFSVTGDRQISAEQLVADFDAALQSSTYNLVDAEGNTTETYNVDAAGAVTNGAGAAMNVALDGSLTADTASTGVALAASDVLAADSGWVAAAAAPNAAAGLGDVLGVMANNETVVADGVTYTADGTGTFTSDAALDATASATAVSNQTVDITSNGQTFAVTFDNSGAITAIADGAGDPVASIGFDSGNIVVGGATAITSAANLFENTTNGAGNFTVDLGDRTLAWDAADATVASTVTFTAAQLEAEIGANDATFASVDSQAYFREGATGNVFEGADNTGTQVNVSSADSSLTTDPESGGVDGNRNGVYTLTNEAGTTFSVEITGSSDTDGTGATLAGGSDTAFVHNGEVFADETIALSAATLADVEALDGVELESAQYTVADGDFAGDYFVGADELVRNSNDFTAEDNIVHLGTQDGEAVLRSGADVSTATTDPMAALDAALNQVDSLRSELGAVQNRFEDAINNLSTNETNLAAARSRIEDADYAVEVADMTRAQILQQAGTSVLAQANQIPQNVLSLLG